MIYVTQGHEDGVGLEVFLKSILCFSQSRIEKFILVCFKKSLTKTLDSLHLSYKISPDHLEFSNIKINLKIIDTCVKTESTDSLQYALSQIKSQDILLTLPTSKDQLFFEKHQVNGYTEYFRKFYKNSNITMNFLAHNQNFLLLSDHISIDEVSSKLNEKNIIQKTELTLNNLNNFRFITDVYFSGIDPHCGENGHISNHDQVFDKVILSLEQKFPNINFKGPFSGDTLHMKYEDRPGQLFIYAYHDQGLAPFKLKNGLIGINLSLGLPFRRVSVDHGTAFDLYGKNSANYQGMLYLMNEIEKWE